jgi:hypothetical protein
MRGREIINAAASQFHTHPFRDKHLGAQPPILFPPLSSKATTPLLTHTFKTLLDAYLTDKSNGNRQPSHRFGMVCEFGEKCISSSGGTNPQNLGLAESESFAIFSEILANKIRIQIPNLKKGFAFGIFLSKSGGRHSKLLNLIFQLYLEWLEGLCSDFLGPKGNFVF